MTLKSAINEKIKNIKGNLLLIGIYDQLAFQLVESNDNITDCMIINEKKFKYNSQDKSRGRLKRFNIKKIRKAFKKKTVENIIINYDEIKRKMHHFIKNSIYISNGNIYIYCNKDEDIDELLLRYKRYDTKINVSNEDEYILVEIDAKNAKNKKLKDIKYYIRDIIYIATDFIGDMLTN